MNEYEQDDFFGDIFKSLPEKKLPDTFVLDTMKRIERETAKAKKLTRWGITAAVTVGIAVVVTAVAMLFPAQYIESLSLSVKESFAFTGLSASASGFGLLIGTVVMVLLCADLLFERHRRHVAR